VTIVDFDAFSIMDCPENCNERVASKNHLLLATH